MPKAKRVLLIAGMMPMRRLIKRQAGRLGMGSKGSWKIVGEQTRFCFHSVSFSFRVCVFNFLRYMPTIALGYLHPIPNGPRPQCAGELQRT